MMNIESILICPECKCSLSCDLCCEQCHTSYSKYYGVYDVVNPELSSNQEILWSFSDEDIANEAKNTEKQREESDWERDYFSHINKETKDAKKKLAEKIMQLLKSLHGDVCDLATGSGGMLQMLLDSGNSDITIVCTDISKRVLAWTRKMKQTSDDKVAYVATDGRYMSLKDNSFDFITSIAAFGNIPESDKVAKELYRILKNNGKLIIQGTYIEKASASYQIAKNLGVEKGFVEGYLIDELKKAGFEEITSTVVGEAVWAENPYDRIPVAGDTQRFCIIQATKTQA